MSQIRAHAISYEVDGQVFEGQLVYDPNVEDPRPGLLMAPNWFGITESAIQTARQVAEERRVVLVADLYGAGVRPADAHEAGPPWRRSRKTANCCAGVCSPRCRPCASNTR